MAYSLVPNPLAPIPWLQNEISELTRKVYNVTGCHPFSEIVLRRGFSRKHGLAPGTYQMLTALGIIKVTVPDEPQRPWQEVIRETG